MPTHAHKRHRVGTGGPWGTGLLVLGIAVTVQGIGYVTATPDRLPPALDVLSEYVPPWVWGCLWMAAGLWSIWQALTPPQRHLDVLPVVGVIALWCAAYLMYWLMAGLNGDWTRGWSSALGWGMLGGYIASMARCLNPPGPRL